MSYFVDPETYEKYREAVLEMSNSVQINLPEHLPPDQRKPPRSDAEIAEALDLDEATVREIRCVAEREYYGLEEWQKALEFKERTCRGYARQGLSFVTKKYVKR
ncbi:MAG: hypothetical protein AAF441_08910 [Pseudomonadota bacterium]